MTRQAVPPLSRFERSPITQWLLDRIEIAEVDEVIPYVELSEIAQDDVQNGARHLLLSARRIALTQHHIPTDAVVNVGIKRLSEEGAVDAGGAVTKHIKRSAVKGQRILATVKRPKELPEEYRQRYDVMRIQLSLSRLFAGHHAAAQLGKMKERGQLNTHDIAKKSLAVFNDKP
jgi:hypothetical protein